jgi:hypothetical protein
MRSTTIQAFQVQTKYRLCSYYKQVSGIFSLQQNSWHRKILWPHKSPIGDDDADHGWVEVSINLLFGIRSWLDRAGWAAKCGIGCFFGLSIRPRCMYRYDTTYNTVCIIPLCRALMQFSTHETPPCIHLLINTQIIFVHLGNLIDESEL